MHQRSTCQRIVAGILSTLIGVGLAAGSVTAHAEDNTKIVAKADAAKAQIDAAETAEAVPSTKAKTHEVKAEEDIAKAKAQVKAEEADITATATKTYCGVKSSGWKYQGSTTASDGKLKFKLWAIVFDNDDEFDCSVAYKIGKEKKDKSTLKMTRKVVDEDGDVYTATVKTKKAKLSLPIYLQPGWVAVQYATYEGTRYTLPLLVNPL